MSSGRQRAVVVALDGVGFPTLQHWIAAGAMPNVARLMGESACLPLRSTIPPVTAPAWCSFATGKNPGKHGVFYFTTVDRASGEEVPVSAAACAGVTLWEWLSLQGRRVVVLNPPVSYPPAPVNGAMVSGFLTPRGARDFVHPPGLLDELEARFGAYPLYLQTPVFAANLSGANVRDFLTELHHEVDYKFRALRWLIERERPDLAFVHIWGTDRIQHELWNLFDEQHPRYEPHLGAAFRDRIADYFRAVDAAVGNLVAGLDDDTSLLLVSDHGFGPIHRFIDLNAWLLHQGYIAIRRRPLSQLRLWLWRRGWTNALLLLGLRGLVRRGWRPPTRSPGEAVRMVSEGRWQPLLSMKDVDWHRTVAYSNFGMGQILVNTTARDPRRGAVTGEQEYRRVRDEIVSRLGALRDPATGGAIEGEIHTCDSAYHGEHAAAGPDIVFLPLEQNYLAGILLGFTFHPWVRDVPALFGNHRMEGILIAHGRPFRGAVAGARAAGAPPARLEDVFPSLAYLLDEPVPTDLDGRVLEEIFAGDVLASRTPRTVAPPPRPATPPSLSADEHRDVLERLRRLGYLG